MLRSRRARSHRPSRCCRRCRVRAQRLRRRARERQGGWPQDRLRQDLSAADRRLRADHPRHPGRQSRYRCVLLLSAGLGGDDSRHQRDRLQGQDHRRRHGRACRPPPSSANSAPCSTASPTTKRGCRPRPCSIPGVNEFLAKYQARAGAEGVDPLGYYLGTWGFAYAQLIEQAIAGPRALKMKSSQTISARRPSTPSWVR